MRLTAIVFLALSALAIASDDSSQQQAVRASAGEEAFNVRDVPLKLARSV
jgi:hypothetical protein